MDAFPAAFLEAPDAPLRQVLTADEIGAAVDLDALRALVADLVARLGAAEERR